MRWFLLLGLPPADRKAALARELAFMHEHVAGLERILALMEADGAPNPLRPSVDLGLRTAATWRSWLEEQLEAAEREAAG